MQSNVRLRSNVFLSGHPEMRLQVRGRPALKKLLTRLAPGMSESDAARILRLKPRQLAELAWEIPCVDCGAVPEGPVLRGQIETVEFRCPRGVCSPRDLKGSLVALDLEMVNEGLRRLGGDVSS